MNSVPPIILYEYLIHQLCIVNFVTRVKNSACNMHLNEQDYIPQTECVLQHASCTVFLGGAGPFTKRKHRKEECH